MLTIAIANGKGGTAKTTTAVNLARALAVKGARVLVAELDPQGDSTLALNVDLAAGAPTTSELLLSEADCTDVIHTSPHGVDLLPATRALQDAGTRLLQDYYRQERLARGLQSVADRYDYCLVDCPPALDVLTANACHAASWLLVPLQLAAFSYAGLAALMEFAQSVRRDPLPSALLISLFDARTSKMNNVVAPELADYNILDTVIPAASKVGQAQAARLPLDTYAPKCKPWLAFQQLADEILAIQKEVDRAAA